MASGRKSKRRIEERPAEPGPGEEAQGEQEEAAIRAGEKGGPEDKPRPRRTPKTRAPQRSATAPAPRQKPAPRAPAGRRDPQQPSLFSRIGQEKSSRPVIRMGGSILLSLMVIAGLFVLFQFFAGSKFFALKGVDVVWPLAEPGVPPLLKPAEVEEAVRRLDTVKRGVLKADLGKIREELMKNTLMREVEVARLLPDRLRVSVVERRPVAVARRADHSVVCVDDEGVMFGNRTDHWRGADVPLINGLIEGGDDAKKTNREWISMYKRLMADLDQTEPPLSSNIDEIFFDKDAGARLMLRNKGGAVLVGKEDFRTRLNVALDILAAVKGKDLEALNVLRIGDAERLLSERINYVNVIDPKRPIVGLDE
jgi:hypothetical protein